jgi:hypothetical protein
MMEEENVCLPQFLGRPRVPSFLDKETPSTSLPRWERPLGSRVRTESRSRRPTELIKTMSSM